MQNIRRKICFQANFSGSLRLEILSGFWVECGRCLIFCAVDALVLSIAAGSPGTATHHGHVQSDATANMTQQRYSSKSPFNPRQKRRPLRAPPILNLQPSTTHKHPYSSTRSPTVSSNQPRILPLHNLSNLRIQILLRLLHPGSLKHRQGPYPALVGIQL